MDTMAVDKAINPALANRLLCYRRGKVPYYVSSRRQVSLCKSLDISYKL